MRGESFWVTSRAREARQQLPSVTTMLFFGCFSFSCFILLLLQLVAVCWWLLLGMCCAHFLGLGLKLTLLHCWPIFASVCERSAGGAVWWWMRVERVERAAPEWERAAKS